MAIDLYITMAISNLINKQLQVNKNAFLSSSLSGMYSFDAVSNSYLGGFYCAAIVGNCGGTRFCKYNEIYFFIQCNIKKQQQSCNFLSILTCP